MRQGGHCSLPPMLYAFCRFRISEPPMPKRLELMIEGVILASRWLLVIFYLGLAVALAVYALTFGVKLWDFVSHVFSIEEADAILKMLGLIDAALVASLVVMVIISGYENFVSKFDDDTVHWLGEIDAGSLKIKVASTIVAISSIHLLQIFLDVGAQTGEQLMWYTIIHLAFVASALFLAYIDRVSAMTKSLGKSGKAEKPAVEK
jgi:uncharacterized protein (TIGR00645 family)